MNVTLCLVFLGCCCLFEAKKKSERKAKNESGCRPTWLKRCGSTVSGRALVRPDSWKTHREMGKMSKSEKGTGGVGGGGRVGVVARYLGGSPVDPAFAIGVDVEQHQAFHQIREDQLKSDELRRSESHCFTAGGSACSSRSV